jgi:hypothetical protein
VVVGVLRPQRDVTGRLRVAMTGEQVKVGEHKRSVLDNVLLKA